MKIEYVTDSLDGVEESLHGAYVQEGDKYHFDADKYAEIKAAGLKTNQAALKKEKDKLKAEYEAYKQKYADLDEGKLQVFRDWQERQTLTGEDDLSGKKPEDLAVKFQGQLKAERQKWETQKQQDLGAKDKELGEWKSKWKRERLSNELKQHALDAGVFKEDLPTFLDLMLMKGHFDLSEDDGEGSVVFIENGGPSALPPDKAMAEVLAKKYPRFFEAPAQGGSGSQGSAKVGARKVDWSKMPLSERLNYGRQMGRK